MGLAGSWLSVVRAKVGRLEALVIALSEPLSIMWENQGSKIVLLQLKGLMLSIYLSSTLSSKNYKGDPCGIHTCNSITFKPGWMENCPEFILGYS